MTKQNEGKTESKTVAKAAESKTVAEAASAPKAEAKTPTRVYVVEQTGSDVVRLVRASTPAGAIRHCTRDLFTAEVASQDDLIEQVAKGVKVEVAGDE